METTRRRSGKKGIGGLLSHAVCLLSILGLLGGHWMVLQSFAWARMISQAARHDSLGTAVAKAFDGKHPCELCLAIKKGRSAEKKSDQEAPGWRLEGVLVSMQFVPPPPARYPFVLAGNPAPDPRSESPPTPPPRCSGYPRRSC